MHSEKQPEGANRAPSFLENLIAFPVRLAGWLSVALLLITLAIVTFAVIRRYVLGSPILWGDELLGYALVAFVMLGAAEALRRGDHIAIDLVSSRLKGSAALGLDVLSSLAVFAFSVVLGISTWQSIIFAYDFGSYSAGSLEVAMWIPQIPMLIGTILLGLTALVRLVTSLTGERPAP